uniref:Uncharacterized protein n=1 Tax=Gasterosteus aculeatus TaxID=69293 RepID=G3NKL1_GASAC
MHLEPYSLFSNVSEGPCLKCGGLFSQKNMSYAVFPFPLRCFGRGGGGSACITAISASSSCSAFSSTCCCCWDRSGPAIVRAAAGRPGPARAPTGATGNKTRTRLFPEAKPHRFIPRWCGWTDPVGQAVNGEKAAASRGSRGRFSFRVM